MYRLIDAIFAWLMRPAVRRVRRWSFVVTLPFALVVAHVVGVQEGATILAARLLLWALVGVVAWRLGGPRGEVMRDLLMHPRLRAFVRAEFDVLTAMPRLGAVAITRQRSAGTTYDRGTFGLALALAFTPVLGAEAAVLHLLIGGGVIAWVLTGIHVYMLIWLWGIALGARAYPHRVGGCDAVLRAGPLHRVRVPRAAVVAAVAQRERVCAARGLVEREGVVLLPMRGRVDVWLELSEPVGVQRPLHEPVFTRHLAVASDDPDSLVQLFLAPAVDVAPGEKTFALDMALGLAAAFDVGSAARDAVQPA